MTISLLVFLISLLFDGLNCCQLSLEEHFLMDLTEYFLADSDVIVLSPSLSDCTLNRKKMIEGGFKLILKGPLGQFITMILGMARQSLIVGAV